MSSERQELALFCRQVAEQTGVSIVVESSLERKPVTLEVTDQSVEDVIAMVARRLGTQVTRTGNLYFIGQLRPEDRGVLVATVGELPAEECKTALGLLLSEHGRVSVSPNGLAVVGDKVEVLVRVNELVDRLRAERRDAWLIQLHLVRCSIEDLNTLGVTSSAGAVVGVALDGGSVRPNGSAQLSAVLDAIRGSSSSAVVDEPLFLVNAGEVATFRRGERVPVVETVSSDRVDRESVRFEEVGWSASVRVRSLAAGRGVLEVRIQDEAIVDSSESYPSFRGFETATTTDVESGGVYLLASFDRGSEAVGRWWGLLWRSERSQASQVYQVWARLHRVTSGGVLADMHGVGPYDRDGRLRPAVEGPQPLPAIALDEPGKVRVKSDSSL